MNMTYNHQKNFALLEDTILRMRLLHLAEQKYGKITPTGSKEVMDNPRRAYQVSESHGLMFWFNSNDGSTHMVFEKQLYN
jgi:hypothetical protein